MKSATLKTYLIKLKPKRLSVKQIVLAAMFLALLTVFKFLDLAMFRVNGYAAWELYFTAGALMVIVLPWSVSALIMICAPFLWLAGGQVTIVSPWSMILDYFVPLLSLVIIKLAPNRYWAALLVLVAGSIKLSSHTISGKLFWETPWEASAIFNTPFTAITTGITLVIVFLLFKKLAVLNQNARNLSPRYYVSQMMKRYVTDFKVLQRGYLNKTYRFEVEGKPYVIKIANRKAATLNTEYVIAKAFYPETLINESQNVLIRPFIVGQKVTKLNALQQASLVKQIEQFHQIQNVMLKPHNWAAYDRYQLFLPRRYFKSFKALREKYQAEPLVVSHNDVNVANLIAVDETSVALIDFEWARLNTPIFDYVSYYVYEDEALNANHLQNPKFQDYLTMTLVFSYLWTFSIPLSLKAWKLRKKFWTKLRNLDILKK